MQYPNKPCCIILVLTTTTTWLFQLPLRKGALGFCPPTETAPTLSWPAATRFLAFTSSNIFKDGQGWERKEDGWLQSQTADCLRRYITPGVDWPEKKVLPNLSSFYLYFADVDQTKRSDRLQARLAAAYRSVQIPELKKRLSPGTVARMESRASRATTLLWKAYPLTQEFALTDEEVRFSVAYATGQRLDMPDRCFCARGTELTMEHTVHCAEKSRGTT